MKSCEINQTYHPMRTYQTRNIPNTENTKPISRNRCGTVPQDFFCASMFLCSPFSHNRRVFTQFSFAAYLAGGSDQKNIFSPIKHQHQGYLVSFSQAPLAVPIPTLVLDARCSQRFPYTFLHRRLNTNSHKMLVTISLQYTRSSVRYHQNITISKHTQWRLTRVPTCRRLSLNTVHIGVTFSGLFFLVTVVRTRVIGHAIAKNEPKQNSIHT